MMGVPYVTDPQVLARYLPAPFRVADEAVVTVIYARNRKVDWLAGHGYNLVSVNASVVYDGEEEQLEGQYTLVMWENLADPILTGRELQGIPKLFAEIPDHNEEGGVHSVTASHFGHDMMSLSVENLRAPTEQEILAAGQRQALNKDHPMAWRFFPSVPGFGSSVNEATTFPSQTHYTEALVGEGKVNFNQLTWDQNPTQCHIVNALQGLPILSYKPALMAKGSVNLILPENPPRTLR
jgi:hypothetical protein